MLYLTLLTPILALPAVMLMDRVERWAAGDTSRPFRPARTAPMAEVAAGARRAAATAGPSSASRLGPAPSGSDT